MQIIQREVSLELAKKVSHFFGPRSLHKMQVDLKEDKSFVTEIDIFVSNLIKKKLQEHSLYSDYAFFSEEDFFEYRFPCAILDPIDGTRELVKGLPECAVSLALMKTPDINNPENYAWIYNPFSGFSLDTNLPFAMPVNQTEDKAISKLLALVSRSEFEKGYYEKYLNHPQINISPRGSIAFKLGLLAAGACNLIISLAPKNVWDIAAGTILCEQRGIHFYENGKRITKLDRQRYEGILVWSPESLNIKGLL